MKKLILPVLALLSLGKLDAQQLFYNDGVPIKVNGQGVVSVYGGITNDNNGYIDNGGLIYTTGDFINHDPAGCFGPANGIVNMAGANQLIGGTQSVNFQKLVLTGTGIKRMAVDATVDDSLALNDRELATDLFTLFHLNFDPASITRTTGFVSSLGNGSLSRNTNQSVAYLYPTGSSTNPARYRPVEITPTSNTPNTYTVRLANYDASIDGAPTNSIDSTVCQVTPSFYHKINHPTGPDAASIAIYYDPATDGNYWNGIGNYRSATGNWTNTNPATSGSNFGLSALSIQNWNTWGDDPYALALNIPPAPVLAIPNVCEFSENVQYSFPTVLGFYYAWNVSGGSVVSGDQDSSVVLINWGPSGPGSITVTMINPTTGCVSPSGVSNVTIQPSPNADFVTDPASVYVDFPTKFIDNSTSGVGAITSYLWDFNGEFASDNENVTYTFDSDGLYYVELVVTNAAGCSDSITKIINVKPEPDFYIPNAFTPNGDGTNESFYVHGGKDVAEFEMLIFDRWGQVLFSGTKIDDQWNGRRGNSGEEIMQGVYTYRVFIRTFTKKEYELLGKVTLIR